MPKYDYRIPILLSIVNPSNQSIEKYASPSEILLRNLIQIKGSLQ